MRMPQVDCLPWQCHVHGYYQVHLPRCRLEQQISFDYAMSCIVSSAAEERSAMLKAAGACHGQTESKGYSMLQHLWLESSCEVCNVSHLH